MNGTSSTPPYPPHKERWFIPGLKTRGFPARFSVKKARINGSLLFLEDELFLRAFNAGLALQNEDNTFADIATMIGNPLKLVSDPEQIGGALQYECIIL
jgi:hypothetical protein